MKKVFHVFLKILFFLFLIAIAIGLILLGLYYSKISNVKYPVDLVIDQVFDKGEEIASLHSDYLLGDNYELDGTLKMTLSSEEYQTKAATDPEYLKKNNLLKNLSKMNVQYSVKHDLKGKKAYASLEEKIGEEEIFSGKFLITNSTQYYFVHSVLKNYVNTGGNTYFESFTEETTSLDNLDYLYHFIRDSIKNNILEEDLEGDDFETYIDNNMTKVGRISYRLTDKSYKKLLKNILKDLKSDERAHQILSFMYSNIDELQVDTKRTYMDRDESYTLYIYVSKINFQPLKVEIAHVEGDHKENYVYEGTLRKGTFYYSVDNETKYSAKVESTSKKLDILVYDHFNKEVGTIKGEKDKNNLLFTMTLDTEHHRYDVQYSAKNKDLKNKEYTREDNLTFKIMHDKVVSLEGTVVMNTMVRGSTKIDEDVSSSVLKSTLTDEENNKMDKLRDTIKERLEK